MKKALAMIEQGHPAPALDLPTDNGGRVSLTALRGKPAVVVLAAAGEADELELGDDLAKHLFVTAETIE